LVNPAKSIFAPVSNNDYTVYNQIITSNTLCRKRAIII